MNPEKRHFRNSLKIKYPSFETDERKQSPRPFGAHYIGRIGYTVTPGFFSLFPNLDKKPPENLRKTWVNQPLRSKIGGEINCGKKKRDL